MLIGKHHLKHLLQQVLEQRLRQGCDLDRGAMLARIEAVSDTYDGMYELALELRDPPLRVDWPYVEPLAWENICEAAPQLQADRDWQAPDLARAAEHVEAGFLASVCGCMLGKPLEVDPTLAELKAALGEGDDWPLAGYVDEAYLARLGRRHDSWPKTIRENLDAVVADDDIHYTLLGMLLLERHGRDFSENDIYSLWEHNLPPGWTWGPERTTLLGMAARRHHLFLEAGVDDVAHDVLFLNPGEEMCGALIRADAYGYACPGNPDLAAWLAWKDASFTHTRTGVYGAMFVAALLALCHEQSLPAGNGRLELAREAVERLPARSRFVEVLEDCLAKIGDAADWEAGYAAVHDRYREYSHCQVYQEIGTLLNTFKFAETAGQGIGMQVSQGNDTDSFGATAGSLLGVLLGPGSLDEKWLKPLNNSLRLSLADISEQSLNSLVKRISALPALVYGRR